MSLTLCTDLWLAVHREAEEAVIGLQGGGVGPDRGVLLPKQRGETRQDLGVRRNDLRGAAVAFLTIVEKKSNCKCN